MRPLVTAFLLVLALAVFFLGVGAVGVWGLKRQQVALAPPPAGQAVEGEGIEEPGDAVPASGQIRADPAPPAAKPKGPFADDPAPARPKPIKRPGWAQEPVAGIPPVRPAPPPLPRTPPAPLPAGPIDLPALAAITHGREIRVEAVGDGYAVAGWRDPQAYVEWPIGPRAGGWYNVEVSFACGDGAGGEFVVAVGGQTLPARARPTGGWQTYRTATIGAVHLAAAAQAEETRLAVRPGREMAAALMNVRHVRLVPAR